MSMLGTQDVMMQISNPLTTGVRHIQVFHSILDVSPKCYPRKNLGT